MKAKSVRRALAVAGAMIVSVVVTTLFSVRGVDAQGSSTVGNPALLEQLRRIQDRLTAIELSVKPRRFYLTQQETFSAVEVLTACEAGFHTASLWEIFDPTNLQYDTTLGFTFEDSGSGPPTDETGWIRTGNFSRAASASEANCNAWTSAAPGDNGTVAQLTEEWEIDGLRASPWEGFNRSCNTDTRVWCVEDRR